MSVKIIVVKAKTEIKNPFTGWSFELALLWNEKTRTIKNTPTLLPDPDFGAFKRI